MKHFFTLVFATLLSCPVFSQSFPEFLIGTWKVENQESYETWKSVTNSELSGFAYKLRDGNRVISENLSIKKTEKGVIYIATVLNQNQGKGIEFYLNQIDSETFSFENLGHDFPKKIVYKNLNKEECYVKVLGKDDKGFEFKMSRFKNE